MGLPRRAPSHHADRHLARPEERCDLDRSVAERLASLEGRCLDCLDERLQLVGPADFTIDGVPATAPIDSRDGGPEVAGLIADFNAGLAEAEAMLARYRRLRARLRPAPGHLAPARGGVPVTGSATMVAEACSILWAYNDRRAELTTMLRGLAAVISSGASPLPASRPAPGPEISAGDIERCLKRLCDVLLGGRGHRVRFRQGRTTPARTAAAHRTAVRGRMD